MAYLLGIEDSASPSISQVYNRPGQQIELDVLAEKANLNAYELRTDPLGWAKNWLAEFQITEEAGFAAGISQTTRWRSLKPWLMH
jgi:hypothetical protein